MVCVQGALILAVWLISAQPPLIAWCPEKSAKFWNKFAHGEREVSQEALFFKTMEFESLWPPRGAKLVKPMGRAL
jgi:hypothetical protein